MFNRNEKVCRIQEQFGLKKKTVAVTLLILMSVGFLLMPLSLVIGQAGVNIYLVSPEERGVVAQNVNLQGTVNTKNGAYQIWFGNKLVVSNNSEELLRKCEIHNPRSSRRKLLNNPARCCQNVNATQFQLLIPLLYQTACSFVTCAFCKKEVTWF